MWSRPSACGPALSGSIKKCSASFCTPITATGSARTATPICAGALRPTRASTPNRSRQPASGVSSSITVAICSGFCDGLTTWPAVLISAIDSSSKSVSDEVEGAGKSNYYFWPQGVSGVVSYCNGDSNLLEPSNSIGSHENRTPVDYYFSCGRL